MKTTSATLLTAAVLASATLQYGCSPCWFENLTTKNPGSIICEPDKVDIRLSFRQPDLAYVGNRFLAVFTGTISYQEVQHIYWSVLDPDHKDTISSEAKPLTLQGAQVAGYNPRVAASGHVALVAWRHKVAERDFVLQFVRMDPQGRALDKSAHEVPSNGSFLGMAVAASKDQFLLVWDERPYRSETRSIMAWRVSRDGQLVGSPIAVARDLTLTQDFTVVAAAGGEGTFVVAWREAEGLVKVARVQAQGTVLDPQPMALPDRTSWLMNALPRSDGRVSVIFRHDASTSALVDTRLDPGSGAIQPVRIMEAGEQVVAVASNGQYLLGTHQGDQGPLWIDWVKERPPVTLASQPNELRSWNDNRVAMASGGDRFVTVIQTNKGKVALVHDRHGTLVRGPEKLLESRVLQRDVDNPKKKKKR